MNSLTNLDRRDRLLERLVELRDDALGRMLRRGTPEPAHLPLLAGINAALEPLEEMPVEAAAAARAVVADDGTQIQLVLYAEAGAGTAVTLDPCRAITIAGKLINAAGLRLGRDPNPAAPRPRFTDIDRLGCER